MSRTGEAGHAVLLAERSTLTVRIDLGNDDLVLLVRKGIRKLLVRWREVLSPI